METVIKVILGTFLFCFTFGSNHFMMYSSLDDFGVCEKPCVNSKQCYADLTCGENEVIQDNATVCGCCPGCVTPINKSDNCDPTGAPCKKGYECVLDTSTKNFTCKEKTGSCWLDAGSMTWIPQCEEDGTYSAVQCKGNDRCFCVAPNGTRIFGFQWIENSANMTCACSRYVLQLKEQGRKDISIHCTESGDFEELQCDNYLCWCAEPRTGKPLSRIVPETMMKLLSCYNATTVGMQYLRQCESYAVASARIEKAFSRHGTTTPNMKYISCDYDGSYGPTQIESPTCYCTWKDGSKMSSWSVLASKMKGVNCNCARDTKYVELDGKGRTVGHCLSNGNYNPSQETEKGKYCVDEDGYTTKTDVASTEKCPGE